MFFTTANPPPGCREKKEREGGYDKDRNEDICGKCEKYETFEGDPLLCCDGPCLRAFHLSCLNLSDVPREDEWLCSDCVNNSHVCFSCKQKGDDNVEEGVFLCSHSSCGRFYHESCLQSLTNAKVSTDMNGKFKYKCPSHICDVCETTAGDRGVRILPCNKCSVAYHVCCVPPSAVHNEYNLHCPEHAHIPLPIITIETCIMVDFASEVFPNIPIPKVMPSVDQARNTNHFRLPFHLLTEVECKPPPFKMIRKNVWLCPQPDVKSNNRDKDAAKCECKDTCGKSCVNFLLNVECDNSNCVIGGDCGNRFITKRKWIQNAPFRFVFFRLRDISLLII